MLGLGEPHNLFLWGHWLPFPHPHTPWILRNPDGPKKQPSLLQSLLHSSVIVTFLKFLSTSVSPLCGQCCRTKSGLSHMAYRTPLYSLSLLCLSLLMLDGPACSQTERLSVLTSGLSHVLFPLPRDRQEHPFSKSFLARFYASFRSQLRLPRMLSLPPP